MAMTPEAKVKKKVKEKLTDMGAYWAMPVTGGYGASGIPDFMICHKGFFIGIETKSGKKKPTTLQQHNLDRLSTAGGLALIINEDNVDRLEELIETWLNTVKTET